MDNDQPARTSSSTPKNSRRRSILKLLKAVRIRSLTSLVLLVAIAAAIFFGWKWHDSQNKLNHPDKIAQAQTQDLVSKVSQLTTLPTGEQPTVATVSDVSKLSGQTFFANAQNGDKVLIYSQAKKAYLYRPSTNKIINIAPLNVNTGQSSTKK